MKATVQVAVDIIAGQRMVQKFHEAFDAPTAERPVMIPRDRAELRAELIGEELDEYWRAVTGGDLVGVADALGDLIYVTLGAAVEHGIDLAPIFTEIHRSNMAKLGADGRPILRDDGKILKPAGWEPPRLAAIVAAQIAGVA